ncbi:MAG: class I SAM-dependent methyltransferase [Anaerolineae bacterium]
MDMDMRDAWNRSSAAYQAQARIRTDTATYGPWCPTEADLRLLGDVKGKRILEVGCGGGQCSIAFARQGAQCIGIDLSDEQIAYARRLAAQEGVKVDFHQGRAEDLTGIGDGSQDAVFSAYALQYVRDIERALSEMARVLRPGGRLVFSLDHPFRDCFWDPDLDEETGTPARSYFQRGAMDWRFSQTGVVMRSYHWTVGDWVRMIRNAGLDLVMILEPAPVFSEEDELAWGESFPFEMARLIPQTIIFVADKPDQE